MRWLIFISFFNHFFLSEFPFLITQKIKNKQQKKTLKVKNLHQYWYSLNEKFKFLSQRKKKKKKKTEKKEAFQKA